MSFTDPQLQARIQGFNNQFEKIEQASESPPILGQDGFTIRLNIISNIFKTMETSLEQISICSDVSKAMFFYKDLIIDNTDFWQEELDINKMLCGNNFRMAKMDMEEGGKRLNAEVALLKAQQGANQEAVQKALPLVDEYQTLIGRFHEYDALFKELDTRGNMGLPLYDADQKPQIAEASPEAYFKALHMQSSQNANMALARNADLAESFFASINFMKADGISLADIQPTIMVLALVLNRFEPLEDARDNRYGFTQIRFE